ncbi:two-component sensor histidine kinase [Paenibacillus agaridevorans]|uniref:histidine kinase n=1 Tax=Paenibacillus agaridevorans TaxID=171404 RepID=A0A2R5EQC2_9BACL|nr:sensor histidine kinase [Paenibacillus agaridevorans]GBG05963.1 two-component sensor histidine kinase [Paenibacillus agaridevorans]
MISSIQFVWHNSTIRLRLIILLLLFVIFPLMIAVFMYGSSIQQMSKEEIVRSDRYTVQTQAFHIDKNIEDILLASNWIGLDSRIITNLLKDPPFSTYDFVVMNEEIISRLQEVKDYMLPGNGEITLIHLNGNVYSTSPGYSTSKFDQLSQTEWFRHALKLDGFYHWFSQDKSYLSVARVLKGDGGSKNLAVLLIQVEAGSLLVKNEEDNRDNRTISLIDNAGTILLSSNPSLIGNSYMPSIEKSIQDDDRDPQSYDLEKMNWKVMLEYDQNEFAENIADFKLKLFITLALLIVLFFLLISLHAVTITKPLRMLEAHFQRINRSNMVQRVKLSGPREVKSLLKHYNGMVIKLLDSLKRNEEESRKKEMARLQALQAQINPHFLFNTLNMIKWTAYMSEAPNVADMVSNLGKMLELSINRSGDFLTLKEELEHLELYIELQKMRFQENFQLEIEVPESMLDGRVPKLLLQPIVENAILHGFAKSNVARKVLIRAAYHRYGILIEVADNGIGISEEKIQEILSLEQSDENRRFSGIGLRNVHDRIQLYFGKTYGIEIESDLNKGTIIKVLIPYERNRGDEFEGTNR